MEHDLLMGVDLGTSGCKACLFDLKGGIVGSAYKEYPSYYPGLGRVEQKAEDILMKIYESCKEAINSSRIDPKRIKAVSFGTVAAAAILVDEDNEPLYNILSWQDARGLSPDIFKQFQNSVSAEEFYRITGHPAMPFMGIPAKYLWMKNNEPEIYQKAAHICSFQDYVTRQFGADGYYVDKSSAGRSCMAETDECRWSDPILELLGIDKRKMAEIVEEPGKVIGKVSAEISERTGLPQGCLICLGAHDQDCCTLGSGGYKAGNTVMTIGTLGSCSVISDAPVRVEDGSVVSNAKQGMDKWVIESVGASSASSFKWFRDTICTVEKLLASENGMSSYDIITNLVDQVPVGCNNISFIPSLSTAEGAFLGISLGTTKKEMARAVMEGIAYEMKEAFQTVLKAGVKTEEIRLAGGVSKNDVWCQMLADIFQIPIYTNQCGEVGCLGAAIFAGVGVGIFDSVEEGVNTLVKFKNIYTPDQSKKNMYEESFLTWATRKQKLK